MSQSKLQNTNKEHLLCFGSLKKDKYNFNRFGGQTFIKSFTLKGYEMYDLGYYPAICPGDGEITVELHEVEKNSMDYIRRMESGAGYDELVLDILDTKASIFTMPKERFAGGRFPKIQNGDWQPRSR